MTRLYILPALLLLMLSAAACDSNGIGSDDGYRVTYTVTATGEGTIDALTYQDADGAQQTVANPVLPWSRRLAMRSGDRAWISVDGTALSGAFTVALQAISGDNVINLNTGCPNSTDEVYPKSCNDLSVERRLP